MRSRPQDSSRRPYGRRGDFSDCRQPEPREGEAAAAYKEAIDSGLTSQVLQEVAARRGHLLARQGEVAGAQAAFEVAAREMAKRLRTDLDDSTIAKLARFGTSAARRPRARPLMRWLAGCRLCKWLEAKFIEHAR